MKESHGMSHMSSEGFSSILVFGIRYMTNPFWWQIQLIHLEGQVTHPHAHHWNPHPHLSLPPLPWLGAVVFEDGSILTVCQFESIRICLPTPFFHSNSRQARGGVRHMHWPSARTSKAEQGRDG